MHCHAYTYTTVGDHQAAERHAGPAAETIPHGLQSTEVKVGSRRTFIQTLFRFTACHLRGRETYTDQRAKVLVSLARRGRTSYRAGRDKSPKGPLDRRFPWLVHRSKRLARSLQHCSTADRRAAAFKKKSPHNAELTRCLARPRAGLVRARSGSDTTTNQACQHPMPPSISIAGITQDALICLGFTIITNVPISYKSLFYR